MLTDRQAVPFVQTRSLADWTDLAIRAAMAGFFAFAAGNYGIKAAARLRHAAENGFDLAVLAQALAVVAICIYFFTVATLYVVRLKPVNGPAGLRPSLAALAGGFLPLGLLLFPLRDDLSVPVQIFSSVLVLGGKGLTAWTLSSLGRSFSILPESRRLVTSGPYAFVRHPAYLFEAMSTIGAMISFLSPGAVMLVAVQFGFQFVRMHYEEKTLRRDLPGYAAYAARTARIIPFVY